jgi:hypothetical protein
MILPLFRRPAPTIAALYGAIVARARDPRFYEDYGVPGTVLGRFDLIVPHLALVPRRLPAGESGVAAERLAAYVRQAADDLEMQTIRDLVGGTVRFPEPVLLAAAE